MNDNDKIRIYSVGVWNLTNSLKTLSLLSLEFTPLEFETCSETGAKVLFSIGLEFTPLEFETFHSSVDVLILPD